MEDSGGLPFTLYEPLTYTSDLLQMTVLVPKGFETDLASIPRLFWRVLPPIGRYDKPAVIHDWLYRHNGLTRLQADQVLLEAMTAEGVPEWQRTLIFYAVRVGGWKPWNRYRTKEL